MATVRLQFELDSDVYPELYAALSALRSTQARNERVRQLATSGLVWENVRIYGAAAIGPSLSTPDLPRSASFVAQKPGVAGPVEPGRQARHHPPQDTVALHPPAMLAELLVEVAPPGGDFVDLAINVKSDVKSSATVGSDDDDDDAQFSQSDVEQVVSELPVLLDIVADDAETDTAVEADTRAPPLYVVTPLEVSPADAEPRQSERQEDAIHLMSLAQKPAMRSRLMRMKERGLFKNG